jgi:hypothetical protein
VTVPDLPPVMRCLLRPDPADADLRALLFNFDAIDLDACDRVHAELVDGFDAIAAAVVGAGVAARLDRLVADAKWSAVGPRADLRALDSALRTSCARALHLLASLVALLRAERVTARLLEDLAVDLREAMRDPGSYVRAAICETVRSAARPDLSRFEDLDEHLVREREGW